MRGLLTTGPATFDAAARWRLDPNVALRPEPFGALAYHYGTRRLTFLRSPLLVDVVRALDGHASATDAVAATVPEPRRDAFLRALSSLATSGFIVAGAGAGPAPAPDPTDTGDGLTG